MKSTIQHFKNLSIFFACLAIFSTGVLNGSRTQSIVHEGFEEFQKGETENVALNSHGILRPVSSVEMMASIPTPIVWSSILAEDGTLYLGTGNDGVVFKVSPEGDVTTLFEPKEVMTRAMILAPEGHLFVGTSPAGSVYKIREGYRPEIYFDPDAMYIWDMLLDDEGNLFVATGQPGRIFKLPKDFKPGDEPETWFSTQHTHVQTLAFDKNGDILAGTGPGGTVFRIEEKGKGFALYHTGAEEIRGILPHEDGSIFFHTFNQGENSNQGRPQSPQPSPGNSGGPSGNNQSQAGSNQTPSGSTIIYRIDSNGFVNRFWGRPNIQVFSLLESHENRWIIGSGRNLGLLEIESRQVWGTFQHLSGGGDVTRMHRDGETYFAITSNPARVYRFGDVKANVAEHEDSENEENTENGDEAKEEADETTEINDPVEKDPFKKFIGTFTSQPIDAQQIASWGRFYATTQMSTHSAPEKVFTRSGNTGTPDPTWSSWLPLDDDHRIQSPSARYIQYRIGFKDEFPAIRQVQIFFRLQNAAPLIESIVMLPVGLEMTTARQSQISFGLEQFLSGQAAEQLKQERPIRQQFIVERFEGAITAGWRASDPNQDRLQFKVQISPVTNDRWTTLARNLREPFLTFDIRGLEEGYYELKIIADDALDNPPEDALATSQVSQPFLIDTTPPSIELLSLQVERDHAKLNFRVSDASGIIQSVLVTLNGDEAKLAPPADGLYDSNVEHFEMHFRDLESGPQSLVIEAFDQNYNRGIRHIQFDVD